MIMRNLLVYHKLKKSERKERKEKLSVLIDFFETLTYI